MSVLVEEGKWTIFSVSTNIKNIQSWNRDFRDQIYILCCALHSSKCENSLWSMGQEMQIEKGT